MCHTVHLANHSLKDIVVASKFLAFINKAAVCVRVCVDRHNLLLWVSSKKYNCRIEW